jgi:hypothetical protein
LGQESRRLLRLLRLAAVILVAGAAALAISRAARDRRHLTTGSARWIWYTREIPEPTRLRFRAWKEFLVAGAPPATAPLLLFADREWSLEANGAPVSRGSQEPGDLLARIDVARFLRTGENRLSVEVESPDGVGGLLLKLELPDGRAIVTDESWRVERLWPASEGVREAVVWGKPPIYPWRYPELTKDQGLGTKD